MYGDNAKAENNYGYDWFPKLDMVYDHLLQFDLMHQGRIKLSSFGELRDDGSTMAACWIYTGCYTEAGNISARRDNADPSGKGVHPNWGFAWPANRRILYNRASADPAGKPWSDRKSYVYWDGYRVKGRPFNIPRISQVDHKAYKCTLCSDRVAVGQGPACQKACPTQAIVFGTKDEMKKWADHRIADLKSRGFDKAGLYDPPGVGGTHVMYVLQHAEQPQLYAGLPNNPRISPLVEAWKGVGKYAGLAVIGLTAAAGLLHHLLQGPNRVSKEDEDNADRLAGGGRT
jgi:ferredoxin